MGRRSNSQKKRGGKNLGDLSVKILKVLKSDANKALNYKQLCAKLGLTDASSRNQVIKNLAKLAAQKQIEEVDRGKFKIVLSNNIYTGIVDINSKGHGYVIVEELEEDIFVPKHYLKKALPGDEVEVYVFKRRRRGKTEGEISQIVNRKKTEFVGTIEVKEKFAFVTVNQPGMYTDFFVPIEKLNGAKNGEVVLIEMGDWPEKADSPYAQVKEVLGMPGEHNTEIHAILLQYGLPYEFPPEVEAYANNLDTSIQADEIAKRRDMRETLTFTIDPKDAKDFDDALSFKKLENGNFEVGVHIADVSHYVQPGTILEEEAYKRATSVYLVDRVVPMLPEVLSNNACSLRPHEEKYTFSAVFEIDKNAKIVNEWFGRTVTYSDARFAYEEAQHIIENLGTTIPADISLTGETYDTSVEISEAILKLDALAKIMREQRMNSGALSFDKTEVKFHLDENNEPVGVFFKTSKDANKLIEEFMLLANKKVSEFIGKRTPKKTFVYRVHDEPDEEKLASLQTIVSQFGHSLNLMNKKTVTSSLNKLLNDVKGKREQNMVDTLAIRTMSKANYTTENIGHYGLAFDHYSHFTSPIRRYPDVMAHRLLQHYLDGGQSVDAFEYEEKCKHSSEMESLAANAERDSIKFMQIKFMQDHENEIFVGTISGVTEWGIYVEIVTNKCEGMIRLRDLSDDHYIFVQEKYAIEGKRTGKEYTLGDVVKVRVKNADLVKRHLDFILVEEDTELVYSSN